MSPQLKQAVELYKQLAGPQTYRAADTPFLSEERLQGEREATSCLGDIALRIVMKILHAARTGRPDLLKAATNLAK